jgi:DNA helicase-2/ATP-dependent DNA helicase PcrA
VDSRYVKTSTKFASTAYAPQGNSDFARSFVSGIKKSIAKQPVARPTTYKPPADFKPSNTANLKEGMRVEHPKFGFGTVAHVDESGPDRKARITFTDFGEKTLLLSFAKLRIVE